MAENWHQTLSLLFNVLPMAPSPYSSKRSKGTSTARKLSRGKSTWHTDIDTESWSSLLTFPDSPEHPSDSVESLRNHLQTAMAIELATIPLYLFGMNSFKVSDQYVNDPRYYDPVIGAIRGLLNLKLLSFFWLLKLLLTTIYIL